MPNEQHIEELRALSCRIQPTVPDAAKIEAELVLALAEREAMLAGRGAVTLAGLYAAGRRRATGARSAASSR